LPQHIVILMSNKVMDNSFTHLSFFISYILRQYCQIYLRKYHVWFEENLLLNIFWENILFDLKKISCPIYFEKIYCLIGRKFIAEYILRKYTVWFEENLSPNIFWENIMFDLKKMKKEWWVKHKIYDKVNKRKTTLNPRRALTRAPPQPTSRNL